MYDHDTFFNLSIAGRAGLLVVSLLLTGGLLLGSTWLFKAVRPGNRAIELVVRLAMALVLFGFFEWLSPQLYYLYYTTLFDGLPWQIVIKSPPSPTALLDLLTLSTNATLSHHSRGALGWALIILAIADWVPKEKKSQ